MAAPDNRKAGRLRPTSAQPEVLPIRLFYGTNVGHVSAPFMWNLIVLLVFGGVILFSASYVTGYYKFGDSFHYIRTQVILGLGGAVVMAVISQVDYRILRYFTRIVYWISIILMVLVFTCEPISGCRRWLNWSWLPITIQPSEIAKFAIIMTTADLYQRYRNRRKTLKYGIYYPIRATIPFLVLLFFQPHKSCMVLVLCILFTMLLIGGANLFYFGGAAVVGVAGIVTVLITSHDYVQSRLETWTLFGTDLSIMDYQTKQSILAIASGGWGGVGIGEGKQKHLWLPEAVNDFIFSVLCEELGFIGAVICILLFAILIFQGIRIAVNAPDTYGAVLAAGITAQVAWQVIFNICVVTATTPNTGISLPFFSSGGTSLVFLLIEMGVLMSVSKASDIVEQRKKQQGESL